MTWQAVLWSGPMFTFKNATPLGCDHNHLKKHPVDAVWAIYFLFKLAKSQYWPIILDLLHIRYSLRTELMYLWLSLLMNKCLGAWKVQYILSSLFSQSWNQIGTQDRLINIPNCTVFPKGQLRSDGLKISYLGYRIGMFHKAKHFWDFPSGPLVKILCFQCMGRGFDPWLGN